MTVSEISGKTVFALIPQLSKGKKMIEWSEAPSVDVDKIGSAARDLVYEMDSLVAPLSLGAPDESASLYEGRRFFVLEFPKGEAFLVDTEGFDYARYILRLENF